MASSPSKANGKAPEGLDRMLEYEVLPAIARRNWQWRKKYPPRLYRADHRIPGRGPVPCDLMIIGARPAEDEAYMDQSFVGATGAEMDRYFRDAEINGDAIYLTNIVKTFRPGNPEPTSQEIERDARILYTEFCRVQPRVIMPLGVAAVKYFLGPDASVESIHGVPQHWEGWGDGPRVVLPAYMPTAGLLNVDLMPHIQNDFNQIAGVLDGSILPMTDQYAGKEQYAEAPDPEKYADWDFYVNFVDQPFLSIDTEGWRNNPWSIQFTAWAGWGFVIRATHSKAAMDRFRSDLRDFLRRGGKVILHNSIHDLEVMRELGVELQVGQFIDTMVLAYLTQLEPQGLKALAKRHCGMEMMEYEELTRDAQERLALEYLLQADAVDWGPAEEYLIMERKIKEVKDKVTGIKTKVDLGIQPCIKKPWPINKRIRKILDDLANKEGTDVRDRWHKVCLDHEDVKERVEAKLGPIPIPTLDEVPLDKAIHYGARDADATHRVFPILWAKIKRRGSDGRNLEQICEIDHAVLPMLERMQHVGMPAVASKFEALGVECERRMQIARDNIKKCTGADINPDSPLQVRELLYTQLGIKPPHFTKKGKQGSTDDKALEAIAGEHEAVGFIGDYREASKIKSSFVDPLPLLLQRDKRIHCTIRGTRVVSGRLAATNPNLLAIPVRTEFGKQVRSCFEPLPGRVLGSWDLDQIEMREMAHQSRDPLMIRYLSDSRYDIHSETAGMAFGLQINEHADNKKERYANIDPLLHRYAAKRVGFGIITGITPVGLKRQMDVAKATINGHAWTEDDCEWLINEYLHRMYPGVNRYIEDCRKEARDRGYVRDRWGRIRYLPAIRSDNPHQAEEAGRQSHSHKISASAQGLIKMAMETIWYLMQHYWSTGRFIECLLQIHDELIFEADEDPDFMKEWDELVVGALTSVDPTFRVPIKAKGSWGKDWGALKD